MDSNPDVLIDRSGGIGRITLNRPESLNALTFHMSRKIAEALSRWRDDDTVALVLLRGAGERAFCAGGDIRHIYEALVAADPWPIEYWREEYALNLQIANYQKPIVAVMHGIVMGGGIGVSAHASHRVVTDTTSIAMPETSIGFLPDVGGSYLLSRAPGETGTHLALTAGRVAAADAIYTQLADVHIASERLGEVEQALQGLRKTQEVRQRLEKLASPPKPGVLAEARAWIDPAYGADSVEEICARLRARAEPGAEKALAQIEANSPTSLKLALRALREGRRLKQLAPCLAMELNIVAHLTRSADFIEGIRAAVIDKDRKPRWRPARLEDVSEAAVEDYFRP
jgi:enoyl-CoA hydratase